MYTECNSIKLSIRHDVFFEKYHGKENDIDFIRKVEKVK